MSYNIKQNIIIYVSTCLKIGYIKKMPGTFGSLAAIPFLPIGKYFNEVFLAVLLTIFFMVGVWAVGKYIYIAKNDDPKEVVIDEFLGLLLTCYVTAFFIDLTPLLIVALFLMFRLFDILKPWPLCFFDKNIKGGFGVMFDDIAASIIAALSVILILKLFL